MESLPTAKELFDQMLENNDESTSTDMMIEFARIHVERALLEASKNARTKTNSERTSIVVDKETILNAYKIENII